MNVRIFSGDSQTNLLLFATISKERGRCISEMEKLLRKAVQQKRQYLIEQLIKSGIYKKHDKHLYEWTLSDLEEEYKYVEANSADPKVKK